MNVMRWIGVPFLLLGAGMLVAGLGGFADEWIGENVSCGTRYETRVCEPGEAQGTLVLVGAIFTAVAVFLLALSVYLGRLMQPMRVVRRTAPATTWAFAGASPAPTPSPAPAAPSADQLVDRLARLADLRDRGVLTDAEFQRQKAKLLGSAT